MLALLPLHHFDGGVVERHPTEKAISVVKPLIETFSPPGGLVLDPFSWSGSTAVAAALAGRLYLGIELEEKYCQVARKRLAGVERFLRREPSRQTSTSSVGAPTSEALSRS
jgi:DNA modification methylase